MKNSALPVIYKMPYGAKGSRKLHIKMTGKGSGGLRVIEPHASGDARSAFRRNRRKFNVRFLRPHHALFLSIPIFLVVLPPIDMVVIAKDMFNTSSYC